MSARFEGRHISDQKRLVRGEHLLLARKFLRARDGVHNARVSVLMLAGSAPREEIGAIRELMPNAHITAVDREESCVSAAREAGADEAIRADLVTWEPPHGGFDLIDLDLCAGVSSEAVSLFRKYSAMVALRGVFMGTFSYGRDIKEVGLIELQKWRYMRETAHKETDHNRSIIGALDYMENGSVPDVILIRLCQLLTPGKLSRLQSIMAYRGNAMPMCSVLGVNRHPLVARPSFVQVTEGDLDLAVTHPDVSLLYAVPRERIEGLRRRAAAMKAVHTRRAREEVDDPRRANPGAWATELDKAIENIDRALASANPKEQRALIEEKQRLAAERNRWSPTYKIGARRMVP